MRNQRWRPVDGLHRQGRSAAICYPSKPSKPISQKSLSLSKSDELIPVSGGAVLVRQIADDNSCLFNSIVYIFERNAFAATKMRNLVADAIAQDPIEYNRLIA
ncbi:hypothetical protein BJ741DRAFT_268102 [Chytriomyces cf. hyalinus JEL632]|nr:hypothetical protein BJ741DRAFT_268102 [Chytriomyces cf. hyalinus JEL632]